MRMRNSVYINELKMASDSTITFVKNDSGKKCSSILGSIRVPVVSYEKRRFIDYASKLSYSGNTTNLRGVHRVSPSHRAQTVNS